MGGQHVSLCASRRLGFEDMPPRDIALVLIVVLAFGSNFTAMKFVLAELPPYLFTALRTGILLPLLLVLPKPNVSWVKLLAIGGFIHLGQFGLLFTALQADATAGLASLLIQAQVPFTILLAALIYGERVRVLQIFGIGISFAGLGIFALTAGGNLTLLGLALILAGALSWTCGNLVLRRTPSTAPLALVVWAGCVPVLPMLGLSIVFETQDPLGVLVNVSLRGWLSLLYVSLASVVVGYSLWGVLLSRHTAANVTPFALLIPVIGMGTAALVLGERLSVLEFAGTCVVLVGLALAVLGPRWQDRQHG